MEKKGASEVIRIFENMAQAYMTYNNMDVRNVPRYDQIIEDRSSPAENFISLLNLYRSMTDKVGNYSLRYKSHIEAITTPV